VPKIDGDANDAVWQNAPVADRFIEFNPGDGNAIPPEYDTKVRILYDDVALYVLAVMKIKSKDEMLTEFGLRDQFVQGDWFVMYVNPFSSPGNNYYFGTFSSGAQIDGTQGTRTDTNPTWNAVWKSAVQITETAWIVEMKIPYAALRFQNENNQTWSVNFARHISKTKQDFSWQYIDKKKDGDLVQFHGKLTDLQNITPPTRLSFYPYTSVVHTRFKGQNTTGYGFGMDLKYGINESYTLDATLIPDFSDTPYDNLELNLGPFEQYYNEQRAFFTEGLDLFNKGKLFYSRRVGNTPLNYYSVSSQLDSDEKIIENPDKTQLINAVKITGRSKNGLGIGFFNAITNETKASIENINTGKIREITTEPLTNYNVLVLDYNYSGNSSVSLINTNVNRFGKERAADVLGLSYNIFAQKNTLKFSGTSAMSMINEDNQMTKGYKFDSEISKKINQHSFGASLRVQDDNYDINDLGYNRLNNFAKFDISYQYSIQKPTKHFNSFRLGFDVGFDRRYKPFTKIQNDVELKVHATNRKYLSYGMGIEYVTDAYDYYEPRQAGRYYIDKEHGGVWAYVSTDYRKRFAVDLHIARFVNFNNEQNFYKIGLSPRFKISNRFKINYNINFVKMNHFKGYVNNISNDIIFGNRIQKSLTNTLGANYYFNTKSGLNLNFRYNWTPVTYTNFYKLEENGELSPTTYGQNEDINYNIWNVDLSYIWEFAPGSKLSLLYRNNIFNIDRLSDLSFSNNVDNLFQNPQKHTFIMKMTYYIDYNTVKNKWF
jgi:hypothetical protein